MRGDAVSEERFGMSRVMMMEKLDENVGNGIFQK